MLDGKTEALNGATDGTICTVAAGAGSTAWTAEYTVWKGALTAWNDGVMPQNDDCDKCGADRPVDSFTGVKVGIDAPRFSIVSMFTCYLIVNNL